MALRDSKALEQLQKRIARQELEKASAAQSNDLFQKLVDADRNLAALLTERDPVIRLPAAGGENGPDSGKGDFASRYSPTFIRLEERFKKFGLDVPLNKTRPVAARTDAENGYLNRPDNPGRVLLPPEIAKRFSVRESLLDGRLTIFLRPLEDAVVPGEAFRFSLGLLDDAMPMEVRSETVEIRVAEPEIEKKPQPKPISEAGRSGGGKDRKGSGEDAPTHGLPKCILLTKDGRPVAGYAHEAWPEGFDENDGSIRRSPGREALTTG